MSFIKKTIYIFLVLVIFASCSKEIDDQSFKENLEVIDNQISQGNNTKALKKLNRLQKKARNHRDYAAIIRRMLSLDAAPDAIFALQKGIEKFPASPQLSAMLVSILIENDKTGEALPYAENLEGTVYAGLAAEAFILADMENKSFNTDFSVLKSAYDLTGKQVFLKNAALNLASRGRLREAADLRELIDNEDAPEEPYFWSCLAFDIGRFAPIFSDLFFSLAFSDKSGGFGEPADLARRHLMLTADAAYGQGDSQRARAFWLAARDRSPEINPVVFYDLALTAPDDKERTDLLMECIGLFPGYYPVIAQYTREYLALRDAAKPDDIAEYLEERGFYSMQMEKFYFASPKMNYKPEELFEKAFACESFDHRFILEKFRYEQIQDASPYAVSRGKAKIWNILEKFGREPVIREYAKWYFSQARDFNACFSLANIGSLPEDDFYNALAASIDGDFDSALDYFASAAANSKNAFAATANMAYIYYIQGKIEETIEAFSLATGLTDDDKKKSRLQYELASVLNERNLSGRAITALEYALDLNPKNYEAEILLKRLKQAK